MSWIRLDDDYTNHPKFQALTDKAFRLWHEGMCYCRKLLTDGVITVAAFKGFRSRSAVSELLKPVDDGVPALWKTHVKGYEVHDYLQWNPSKEKEVSRKAESRDRLRLHRERKQRESVDGNAFLTRSVRTELDLSSSVNLKEKKELFDPLLDQVITTRAGVFVRETYPALYKTHRKGARYVGNEHRDYQAAVQLCAIWDDERLGKLAVVFLNSDHKFAEDGSRTIPQFKALASWCDGKLAEREAERRPA